jgi:hypothetical protein
MQPIRCLIGLFLGLTIFISAVADPSLSAAVGDKKPDQANGDDGFVPMFNGKDLTGWVNVNCAPSTFYVKDNQIITTGKPTGYLRTEKHYENFIAEFDWMHVPPAPGAEGNSGFFVWADPIPAVGTGYTRGIEVQVLVNLEWNDKKTGKSTATSHGDLFSIWGAECEPDWPHPLGWKRCIPKENRAKGANEWNHYRVEANDGVIKLAVNGKVVSGVSKCNPRKGYLALESEGSECRFKNLKIKELSSTKPKAKEIADVAQGHKSLYNGLDLSGWKADEKAKKYWQPKDTVLHYDGKGKEIKKIGGGVELSTEKKFGDSEFIVDFRFPDKGSETCRFFFRAIGKKNQLYVEIHHKGDSRSVNWGGGDAFTGYDDVALKPRGQWNRLQATLNRAKGKLQSTVKINGTQIWSVPVVVEFPMEGTFSIQAAGPMDFANLFVRELKK